MFKNFKQLEPQLRSISTHVKIHQKSHYDALGITSKATQADIKSAYYKLSMMYHPDKNKKTEDTAKFRDISEAYEVLGNVKTRKLYDKGLFIHNAPSFDDTPLNRFYKSRETKSKPPAAYGRTTIYDFDEWSRSHYGATFEKDMRNKANQRFRREREQKIAQDVQTEKIVFLIGVLFLTAYLFYDKDFESPDRITTIGGHVVVTPKRE